MEQIWLITSSPRYKSTCIQVGRQEITIESVYHAYDTLKKNVNLDLRDATLQAGQHESVRINYIYRSAHTWARPLPAEARHYLQIRFRIHRSCQLRSLGKLSPVSTPASQVS
jgi:hypothetical protein